MQQTVYDPLIPFDRSGMLCFGQQQLMLFNDQHATEPSENKLSSVSLEGAENIVIREDVIEQLWERAE